METAHISLSIFVFRPSHHTLPLMITSYILITRQLNRSLFGEIPAALLRNRITIYLFTSACVHSLFLLRIDDV